MPNPRRIEYMSLSDIPDADVNPKEHDHETIVGSVDRFGFVEPVVIDERTGKLVSGHGRKAALLERVFGGDDAPEGIIVKAGEWMVPVVRGWASRDDREASAFLVAANQSTIAGGWRTTELATLLQDLYSVNDEGLYGTGYTGDMLDDLMAQMGEVGPVDIEFNPVLPGEVPGYGTGGDNNRGAYAEPTIDDRLDKYKDAAIRSLVLDYKLDEYEAVVGLAVALRAARGLGSNAELFAELLREAS